LEPSAPWLARARRWKTRAALAGRWLYIHRIAIENAAGRRVAWKLAPILASPGDVVDPLRVARAVIDDGAERAAAAHQRFWETRLERERRIADALAPVRAAPVQTGLFDRRAERAHVRDETAAIALRAAAECRLADADRESRIARQSSELLLVLR